MNNSFVQFDEPFLSKLACTNEARQNEARCSLCAQYSLAKSCESHALLDRLCYLILRKTALAADDYRYAFGKLIVFAKNTSERQRSVALIAEQTKLALSRQCYRIFKSDRCTHLGNNASAALLCRLCRYALTALGLAILCIVLYFDNASLTLEWDYLGHAALDRFLNDSIKLVSLWESLKEPDKYLRLVLGVSYIKYLCADLSVLVKGRDAAGVFVSLHIADRDLIPDCHTKRTRNVVRVLSYDRDSSVVDSFLSYEKSRHISSCSFPLRP